MSDSKIINQLVSLSGLWQAVDIINRLSTKGELVGVENDRFINSINSLFVFNANSPTQVYGSIEDIEVNLLGLNNVLINARNNPVNIMRCMYQLILLQKQFSKDRDAQNMVAQKFETLAASQEQIENRIEIDSQYNIYQLSEIYKQTFNNPEKNNIKLIVLGEKEYLTNEAIMAKIRALLLAGLRAIMLWRQMGGNIPKLLLFRKKYTQTLHQLLLSINNTNGKSDSNLTN